ncbi:unnamed protein product [Adineta steineri]|uniref:DUF6570 domain-containing protein n=1 Tax=Adineta steineri TaxID=433720 RepID=A0A815NR81_9BILA|nr:unnamed protein product [Adineta steineri]CAF4139137.1 unnamed protein product [Adineta steineri]
MYANVVGPIDIAIKGVCKNYTYSELYEICALCTILGCNIRSVYPEIDFHPDMAVMNNIFTPAPSVTANYEITILWSHAWDQMHARAVNNNTPEKQTLKNNTSIQIRIPEFQDSPNRRFRADNNVIADSTESISLKTRQQNYNKGKTQQETRLEQERNRHRIRRANQTEEEHQIRLQQQRKRDQSRRANQTEEEHHIRLQQQAKRRETNRVRRRLEDDMLQNIDIEQHDTEIQRNDTEISTITVIRNIRTQAQSNLNSDSSSFYYEHDTVLYKNGLFQQNKKNMCTMCQKCHTALSKGVIPKFSAANNMWLGDVPIELQGLTIPEEKLISLHRHSSCIIKLQSPFHSMATTQGALKSNCITFLQNTPNIVNSLPLKMADLCDTLKVIFIGAHPPERLQLKRILTVRKKKIVEALRWLKKYNILYKNVDMNLDNIAELPEDNIPETIMTIMEQILNDKEVPSERAGYIPDALSNSTELNISNVIPVNNSAVLDVNGSSISSEEINNYLLNKIKNGGTNDEMNVKNVYLIPHSSKPVNEYFNPKLLAGLYPTLFCYGLGAPEDRIRPLTINFREHIRYLLSYDDRRFEKNHSFIFVVFNLLQRRDACFHAQLIATKPYFRSSAQEIHSLNTSDIEAALKNISTGTHNTGSN